MSVRYTHNTRQTVDVLITANTEIVIAGNSTVSNIALDDQNIIGASIKHVFCSSPSGNGAYWEISRGNTTVSNVVFAPDSTAYIDFAGNGVKLDLDASANLVCKLVRAADDEGVLVLTLHKEDELPSGSSY